MSKEALIAAPVDTGVPTAMEHVTLANPPALVLREAAEAASALHDVLAKKPNKVVMNDQQYLEFEDWQTVGRFYGITCGEESEPVFVEFGDVRGFKSTAVAMYRGEVISRATAYCLNDEEKWRGRPKYAWHYVTKDGRRVAEDPGSDQIEWEPNPKKPGKSRPKKERVEVGEEAVPLFQLASMAQTRANAKVLRNVLAWVVVLAGYRATPAEELQDRTEEVGNDTAGGGPDANRKPPAEPTAKQTRAPASPARKAAAPPAQQAPKPTAAAGHVNGGGKWQGPCPRCQKDGTVIKSKYKDGFVCWRGGSNPGCGYEFTQDDGAIHQDAQQRRQEAQGDMFDGPREPGYEG